MGWDGYGEGKGGGTRNTLGYVTEGKVQLLSFSEAHQTVRFLTLDVKVDDVMAARGLLKDEARDYLFGTIAMEEWVMPVSRWEHSIKEIPGKRFYSTVVCPGRGSCPLCAENEAAKNQGVTENKLLPYPVRKRFFVPVWSYDLKMALFLRGAEDFFDGVAAYINKNGVDSDFEIWKTGKGFNTTYHSMFMGAGKPLVFDRSYLPGPGDLDFNISQAEWDRRLSGAKFPPPDENAAGLEPGNVAGTGKLSSPAKIVGEEAPSARAKASAKQAGVVAAASQGDSGVFVVPFGSYKGKTLAEISALKQDVYIVFLAKNSTGIVQQAAAEFLKEREGAAVAGLPK